MYISWLRLRISVHLRRREIIITHERSGNKERIHDRERGRGERCGRFARRKYDHEGGMFMERGEGGEQEGGKGTCTMPRKTEIAGRSKKIAQLERGE